MKQRLSRWMIALLCCLWTTGAYALVGDIQLLNRWPMAGPNSIAIADIGGTTYIFCGDGEVVSVYDTTYTSSSGCAVESLFPHSGEPSGLLKGLFR